MPTAKPSLRFTHSPALRTQTLKVLAAIDTAPDPTKHVQSLTSVVLSLTDAGMEYYFLKPIKDAKLSFVARQTASFGISGAIRIMSPIVKAVLGGANADQLRVISRHIRHLTK
jgi:hypothetical protein